MPVFKNLFFAGLIFYCCVAPAQRLNIDSLTRSVSVEKEDTLKVKTLYALSRAYSHDGNYHKGIQYALLSAALADSLNYGAGSARASMAVGIAFRHLGNYPEALKYNLQALKKYESIGSDLGAGDAHNLVGNVYYDQHDFEHALEQYKKAENCFVALRKKERIAGAMNNIANVYSGQGEFQKAIGIYDSILVIRESINNGEGISDCYLSMGEAYKGLHLYDSALIYYRKAIPFYEENGYQERTALTYGSIGELMVLMKRYAESKTFFGKALVISEKIGYSVAKMEIYSGLAKADSALGDYKSSLVNYKLYMLWKDSIQNEGNTKKQTQIEMQYEFDRISTADSIRHAEQKKQDDLKHDQEIKQQKIYTYGGIAGFMLMLVVAAVSFRAYRHKQSANEIISKQKELVEEKQKEILDSIHYAEKIQKSLLPTKKYIQRNLDRLKGDDRV